MLRATAWRFAPNGGTLGATRRHVSDSLLDAVRVKPSPFRTHSPANQSAIFAGNIFRADAALIASVRHAEEKLSTALASEHLDKFGAWAGAPIVGERAHEANTNTPALRQYDRNQYRVDVVNYHPSYHYLMGHAISQEVPSYGWNRPREPGSQITRAALAMMSYQAEAGTSCPLTMTFAAVPALRVGAGSDPYGYFKEWQDKAVAAAYDPRNVPISEKKGVLLGMSMTELTGGSDVRANTTKATPLGSGLDATAPGAPYTLKGHKFFTSAPMNDGFLTLAYAGDKDGKPALSCFLVPRWLPDGSRNEGFQIMRLKDKLGDKSNASSEVCYDNAVGFLLGPLGRGVPTILEMVTATRLDCTLGSAGLMRQAVRAAAWYATGRQAFGMTLASAPAMTALLADLSVESEAAVHMAMHMAAVFDSSYRHDPKAARSKGAAAAAVAEDPELTAFRRLATSISKYWVCKRAPNVVYEALEAIGGNGYVHEWPLARAFAQSPLNSVWEGSGNVIALDILKTLAKEPRAVEAFMKRVVEDSAGVLPVFDAYVAGVQAELKAMMSVGPDSVRMQTYARHIAEKLALTLQGSCFAATVKTQAASDPGIMEAFRLWAHGRINPATRSATYGALNPVVEASVPAPEPGTDAALTDTDALFLASKVLDRELFTMSVGASQ